MLLKLVVDDVLNDRVSEELQVALLLLNHLREVIIVKQRLMLRIFAVHMLQVLADPEPLKVYVLVFDRVLDGLNAGAAIGDAGGK